MATTAPAAIDALFALAQSTLPSTVQCFDGHPGSLQPSQMFSIGGAMAPTVQWHSKAAELGAQSREEDYSIYCMASAAIGASGTPDEINALEKQVRDEAWAIVQALEVALKACFVPGGSGLGSSGVRYAQIIQAQADGTNAETVGGGRLCTIDFYVRCQARVQFP